MPMNPSTLRAAAARRNAAFTLLEVLVVIAILGLLVGLVVSKMTGVLEGQEAKVAKLFVDSQLSIPLQRYRIDTRSYPSTADGIQALITKPANVNGWSGPYIDGNKIPLDPWQSPYQYQYPGKYNTDKYDVWSMGPDKQSGTADDIGNWDSGAQAEGEGSK